MIEFFPKIEYQLEGKTLEFTDIFKFIKIDTTNFNQLLTVDNNSRQRPDQLSQTLFGTPNFYWSLFLMNDIKNPFKQWNQTEQSILEQNKAENNSYVFQFSNSCKYLPSNSSYFSSNSLDSYLGVSFSNIKENDVLIYETGGGPLRLKVFGSGVLNGTTCGSPHFGQSTIPDNFSNRNNIKIISAGSNFSSCLDTDGRIWGWGEDLGLTGFSVNNTLYYTPDSGYESLNTTNKIIASKTNQWWCWGSGCSAGTYPITESKTISKTDWTKGVSFSGMVLFSDNTVKFYGGITSSSVSYGSENFTDISCSSDYCIGINSNGLPRIFAHTGNFVDISAIPAVSTVSCGKNHCIFIGTDGVLYYSGKQDDSRINLPTSSWSLVGAGFSYSAAIDSLGELSSAGAFLTNTGKCSGSTVYTTITNTITGKYEKISCGDHHMMLLGTGDVTRYFGTVYNIDENYNRIFIKNTDATTKDPVYLDDPSGSFVAIYRNNNLVGSIQHQLLSVDSYLNTTQYIRGTDNTILDIAANDGQLWKTNFIINYKNHENNESFITPIKIQKEAIDTKNIITYVSNAVTYKIQKQIQTSIESSDNIEIKLTEL